uniref:Uncharacterized protein n=1 Tax=Heterorhabditis bacteriophora TaxID=37862 RepID=A0A1I7WA54_HETBA
MLNICKMDIPNRINLITKCYEEQKNK